MYRALVRKDAAYEGIFFAAVKTTGIFCRPTCRARKPKRENTEFFGTAREALLHGYRPCKMCSPLEDPGKTPSAVQRLLDYLANNPLTRIKDSEARAYGVEPHTLRRWFKNTHGITFQGYQRMLRINAAFLRLARGEKVIDTALESGYDSLSGFGHAFKRMTGASPLAAKTGATVTLMRLVTPLGPMIAGATVGGICLLEFTDRRRLERELVELQKSLGATLLFGRTKHLEALEKQLAEYFSGQRRRFDLPLVMPGTEFQQEAWRGLLKVPFGNTRSYAQQAVSIRNARAVRAVALANGRNRISIVVPCHRIIGSDGSLTGYGGGLWRKKYLLDFEKGVQPAVERT